MQQKRLLPTVLRLAAGLILLLALLILFLPAPLLGQNARIAPWAGFILMTVAACVSLLALASIAGREVQIPPSVNAGLARLQQQVDETQARLTALQRTVNQLPMAARPPSDPASDIAPQIQELAAGLAELRELAMLPDADRVQRAQTLRQDRKGVALKELAYLIASREWAKAERALIQMETEYPADQDVTLARKHLNHSRTLVEEETMLHAIADVERLVASGTWDGAFERARQLLAGFPTSLDAQALVQRVEREHTVYLEATSQHLFEQIRGDINARAWRQGLARAERLLELNPEHRLAEEIRKQLPTLRTNAEIEERQGIEIRIHQCVHDRKFEEAIELAEDVIRRFPNSPQAESLDKLLPRLKEFATMREEDWSPDSPAAERSSAGADPAGHPSTGLSE